MNPNTKAPSPIVWWIIWFAIIAGLTAIYLVSRPSRSDAVIGAVRFLPLAPLFLSCVVRWLVLPKLSGARSFPIFLLGVALAEAVGIQGVFLVPSLKLEYFVASLVALAQFMPVFITSEKA